MQQNQQGKKLYNSMIQPGFAGTDANKVKKEIQKDINAGQGAMTSREAGSVRD